MAYTDAATLKTYLGISGSGDDTLLTALIARAQLVIDRHTGKTFEASANTTISFDADIDVDGSLLTWARYGLWLASVNTVTNGDGTTVAASDYVTEPRYEAPYYGIRLLASSDLAWEFPSNGDPEDAIDISGRWAYSTTAGNDIVHATLRLAGWLYRQRDNADMDRPVVVGNATILPAELPRDVIDILRPYMRTF